MRVWDGIVDFEDLQILWIHCTSNRAPQKSTRNLTHLTNSEVCWKNNFLQVSGNLDDGNHRQGLDLISVITNGRKKSKEDIFS